MERGNKQWVAVGWGGQQWWGEAKDEERAQGSGAAERRGRWRSDQRWWRVAAAEAGAGNSSGGGRDGGLCVQAEIITRAWAVLPRLLLS